MKTIYILWLRQIKRYFRSKARIIGSIGQPLLFLVALGFGMESMFEKAGEGDYLSFLSPGIIAMSILFSAVFTGIDVIWDRKFGFLKETLVAPVSRLKIMLGRTLGGATTSLFQGLLVLIIAIALGFNVDWASIPLAILFMFLISLFFTSFGTIIGSIIEDTQAFQLIMNFIIMPVFFLSGSLFPIEGSSQIFKTILTINPLSYGVDGIRGVLTGQFYFNFGIDLTVLLVINILALIIGGYAFSKVKA